MTEEILIVPNGLNKDSMDKKKQIEQLYTDALYNDEAPNVFADRILSLFEFLKSVCEHSWINTGMTLQGVTLKRCMKCGKTEQTVL